ncbi:MAG: ion channel [Rikenellaceae bacterium]
MILRFKKALDPIVVIASVVLLVALSVEIINGRGGHFSTWYVHLQFVICLLYIIDFVIMTVTDRRPMRYCASHIVILIISLPYLSIIPHLSPEAHREWGIFMAIMPQLRTFVALYMVLRWLMRKDSVARLFYAYILSVVALTYISALIFYDCEAVINSDVKNFGDALWWAGMGLTTAGTTIDPITLTGRVLGVIMPLMGMMMLPIATGYLVSLYKHQ